MPENHLTPIILNVNDIADARTNHQQSGVKRVFITNQDTVSALTQAAHGYMQNGEQSGLHQHASMDEYFYFIKGTGIFTISTDEHLIRPGTFFRVPATIPHNLAQSGDEVLEFFYFGVAVG